MLNETEPLKPDDGNEYTVEEAIEAIGLGWSHLGQFTSGTLFQMATAMEMLILSFVGPAVKCEWKLDKGVDAWITTAVFCGFLIGAPLWGSLADQYGRSEILTVGAGLIFLFGAGSALAPNIWVLIGLRGLTGFAISVAPLITVYFTEHLPTKDRGFRALLFATTWSFGGVVEVLLAWLVMPSFGWQGVIVLSSISIGVASLLLYFAPDSPPSLYSRGKHAECEELLQKMAASNGITLNGRLRHSRIDGRAQEGKTFWTETSNAVAVAFSPHYYTTTLWAAFIIFANAFLYYGSILLSSEVMVNEHAGGCGAITEDYKAPFSQDDFGFLLLDNLGELPGILLATWLNRDALPLGRRRSMAIMMALAALGFGALYVPPFADIKGIVLFVPRTSIAGSFSTLYIYLTEVYPACIRSSATGAMAGISRFGAMAAPLVASSLFQLGYHFLAYGILCMVTILGIAGCLLLPIETAGTEMEIRGGRYHCVAHSADADGDEDKPLTSSTKVS